MAPAVAGEQPRAILGDVRDRADAVPLGLEHPAVAGEGAVAGSDVLVRRITTWDAKDELHPGTPVFLLDCNPDSTRAMETKLIYLAPGVAQRRNRELVRVGKKPSERQALQIAADFEHTHRTAA
jgi:hypothetical protein